MSPGDLPFHARPPKPTRPISGRRAAASTLSAASKGWPNRSAGRSFRVPWSLSLLALRCHARRRALVRGTRQRLFTKTPPRSHARQALKHCGLSDAAACAGGRRRSRATDARSLPAHLPPRKNGRLDQRTGRRALFAPTIPATITQEEGRPRSPPRSLCRQSRAALGLDPPRSNWLAFRKVFWRGPRQSLCRALVSTAATSCGAGRQTRCSSGIASRKRRDLRERARGLERDGHLSISESRRPLPGPHYDVATAPDAAGAAGPGELRLASLVDPELADFNEAPSRPLAAQAERRLIGARPRVAYACAFTPLFANGGRRRPHLSSRYLRRCAAPSARRPTR